ncbi:MAG: apolipoprotein N-acyltransferase [Rickettsiales bacterium]|nr:apolipoprotein N-acyltransferase [Rickettsiales bacterium]
MSSRFFNKKNLKELFCCKSIFAGALIFFTTAPFYFFILGFLVISYFFRLNFSKESLTFKLKKSFAFGLGFYFANYYWMTFSMLVDFKTYWFYFFPSLFVIPAYFSIFYILPQTYILDKLCKIYNLSKLQFYFVSVLIWFSFEVIRSSSLFLIDFQGFNWGLLGYNFFANDYLAQIFSITGIYLASLLIVMIYALPFLFYKKGGKFIYNKRSYNAVALILIVSLIAVFFYGRSKFQEEKHLEKLSYLIIHPSIEKHHGFVTEKALANIDKQIALVNEQNNYYDLVIFPEGGISFPVDLASESSVFDYILSQINGFDYLIAGSTRYDVGDYYNSLFVYKSDGVVVDFYDKKYLVPFGEYIPYLRIFDSPLTNNSSGFKDGELKSISLEKKGPELIPLICYDALFLKSVLKSSGDIIINISNDIWFIQKLFGVPILSAAYQHLDIVRARAIESNLPVLRSTNLGFSAVIDGNGTIVEKAMPYESGVLKGTLEYSKGQSSFFKRLMKNIYN